MFRIFLVLLCINAKADDALSLSDILDLEVEVATKSKQSIREAPNIISVVTKDRIAKSGARDLVDVLRLVPGFTFAQDVLGMNTFVTRGIYAGEGKILVLMDGVELNDISYGTHSLRRHFPVELIEKIEIIRGPGSALYGGFAELGVINIVTKSHKLDGLEVTSTIGKMDDVDGTRSLTYAFGKKIEGGEINFNTKLEKSDKSVGDYKHSDGTVTKIDESYAKNKFLNLGIKYKGFKARALRDFNRNRSEVLWGGTSVPYYKDFETEAYNAEYEVPVDKLKITPYFSTKKQIGWWQPDAYSDVVIGNDWRRRTERTVLGTLLRYQFSDNSDLALGFENTKDSSEIMTHYGRGGTRSVFNTNKVSRLTLERNSYFAQFTSSIPDLFNITVGGRYEDADEFDNTFVPRFGITKVMGDFHIKLLGAQAFRLPSIENYDLNNNLKPEITTTFELESGYKVNDNIIVLGSLFSTKIEDIIVYYYNSGADTEHYYNYDEISTMGLELEVKFAFSKLSGNFGLTYQKANENKALLFKSGKESDAALNAPELKETLELNYLLTNKLNVNLNVLHKGSVYAYEYDSATNGALEKEIDSYFLFNLYFLYEDVLPSLDVGLGVKDLFDENPSMYQAANNGAMPYPGIGREFLLRLSYSYNF